ncbi:MAG: hypothetical protein RLZZ342_309 [Candidatus Parcubacteria bacterium]|jgi:hypothetical protein
MSPSVPLGDKGLTQREIAMIAQCIQAQKPTHEELKAFFDPLMIQQRISEWFARFRAGEFAPVQQMQASTLPILQQDAIVEPQS